MADTKVSDLSSATPATNDLLYLVDVSDTTDNAAGSSKNCLVSDILALASFDMLSKLASSEISITSATTATLGRMHVCSGTSANYTVTLPSPTGNAGKLIGLRMAAGLTKLVTIDAGSGVLINGTRTRIMWAGESAILLCDGSNWFKIAGKFVPMSCNMARATSLSGGPGSLYIPMNTTISDPTGAMADTSTNYGIVFARPGTYLMLGTASYSSLVSNATNIQAKLNINGTQVRNVTANGLSGAYLSVECSHTATVSAGDALTLSTYLSLTVNLFTSGPPYENQISVLEMPSW